MAGIINKEINVNRRIISGDKSKRFLGLSRGSVISFPVRLAVVQSAA